ncbi:winged helix-turn-helix transcriptional regulator [Candidatus Woesearchaeota archaeon]|nr:winged helix-turn-helix transcriptional regulator [Candidatus Woesearchaeota archaeon]
MKEAEKIFKALANPTRLKIVYLLLSGERCVCKIVPHLKRTQSTTSIQLNYLENKGIIKSKRDGKYIYYMIDDLRIQSILKILGIKVKEKTIKNQC